MAKGNRGYQRSGIEKEQNRSQGEYDSFLNQFTGRSANPVEANRQTGTILGRNPATATNDNQSLSDSPRYKQILEEGANERGYLQGGLRGLSETGGVSDEDIAGLRSRYEAALGGGPAQANLSDFTEERNRYRDFADTGGYSAGDIQRTRAQAARSAPSFYNALQQQQQLAQSRMGANAGAGFDPRFARQAAQGSAADKLSANIGLAESQRAGKQFGIQGLESTGTESGRQSLQQAGLTNQYNLGRGSIVAGAEGDIAGLRQRGKVAGLTGLGQLYGQAYAPESEFNKTWLDAIGASSQSAARNRQLNLSNDEINRSRAWENAIGMVGAVGSIIPG